VASPTASAICQPFALDWGDKAPQGPGHRLVGFPSGDPVGEARGGRRGRPRPRAPGRLAWSPHLVGRHPSGRDGRSMTPTVAVLAAQDHADKPNGPKTMPPRAHMASPAAPAAGERKQHQARERAPESAPARRGQGLRAVVGGRPTAFRPRREPDPRRACGWPEPRPAALPRTAWPGSRRRTSWRSRGGVAADPGSSRRITSPPVTGPAFFSAGSASVP
jgi:hypothetical protein